MKRENLEIIKAEMKHIKSNILGISALKSDHYMIQYSGHKTIQKNQPSDASINSCSYHFFFVGN